MDEEENRLSLMPPSRLLIVEDDPLLRKVFVRMLGGAGHDVVEAANGVLALEALDEHSFDAIITDIGMPQLSGTELLRAVRQRDLDVPVVMVTGDPSLESVTQAIEFGALDYLVKPVAMQLLREKVARAIRLGHLARCKREAMYAAGDGLGPGDRAGLEATFTRAMRTLRSAFQPIVRADGTRFGHEALLRSNDPDLPAPGVVIDAAQKLGRLGELGRRMRALATAPVAATEDSGDLFVNVHPRDLFDPELLTEGSPLLAIASRVVLEITERAPLDQMGDVRSRAAQLRERGFRLAIDDLGAGYAGLTSFAMLSPEIAKLDLTLVRGVDKSAIKQKIVRSMTRLCRDLGMLIVAEGVETDEELQAVTHLGCDLVQGFLIGRPGPAFPAFHWPTA